jgi:hypothetical protein
VIQSDDYNIIIEFSGKGWLSGDKHTFNGVVRKNGSKEQLYIASGTWSGKSTLENCRTNEKATFLDIQGSQRAIPIIAPEEDQNALESRKLWKYVSQAIDSGDFATASRLKVCGNFGKHSFFLIMYASLELFFYNFYQFV